MKTEGKGILKLDNGHRIPVFWSCSNPQKASSSSLYTVYVNIDAMGSHKESIKRTLRCGGFGRNPLSWGPDDIAVVRFHDLNKVFKLESQEVEGFHTYEYEFKNNVVLIYDTLEGDLL